MTRPNIKHPAPKGKNMLKQVDHNRFFVNNRNVITEQMHLRACVAKVWKVNSSAWGWQVNIKRDRRATLIHPSAGMGTLLIGFINWSFWSAFSSEELGKKRRWSREWLSVPSQWLPVWFLLINPFWSVGFDALLVLGKSSEEETKGSGVGAALSSVPVIAVSK